MLWVWVFFPEFFVLLGKTKGRHGNPGGSLEESFSEALAGHDPDPQ